MSMSRSLLILLLFLGSISFAQTNQRDMQKEAAIWEQLQTSAPQVVNAFKEATRRMDEQDYKSAATVYQQVLAVVPRFDPALRRLGMCLAASGEVERGTKLIEQALEINRSAENLSALADALSFPAANRQGSLEDMRRALVLIQEAISKEPTLDLGAAVRLAQISSTLNNETEFRKATSQLLEKFPNEPVTHYFTAVRAAMDEKWTLAEDEITRAGELGLSADVVKEFLDSGVRSRARVWRLVGYALRLVVAWAAGLMLLFVMGKTLSALTLRSIEQNLGKDTTNSTDLLLRRTYKGLITVAGLYYYISMPVVILLLIGLTGSIFYASLMLGRIPIRLMLILVLGTVITIYKMIQSLFVKVTPEDPGRSLSREEAPALWTLAEVVAQDVGTRPVEEIRITPGTDLAVYERGTRKEKAQDKARRVLILGIGVLNGFRVNAFRAVLAHEYGHFAHRDTAGGDIALRVNNDMWKFMVAIAMAGQAVWWNLALHFLRLYHFLFRRISHGASRLQEVLADRVAAIKYGADSFEEGLRHVIRRSVEFNLAATREVDAAVASGRPLNNLYDLQLDPESSVEAEVKKALSRPTSEDDTHPSPSDRFRFIRQVGQNAHSSDQTMLWEFFVNRDSLTLEMSSWVNNSIQRPTAQPTHSVPQFKEVDL